MEKIYKVILVIEVVLLLIFCFGYFAYEYNYRQSHNETYDCGIEPSSPIVNLTNINNSQISIQVGQREDLNS